MARKQMISSEFDTLENSGIMQDYPVETTQSIELSPLARQMLNAEKNSKFPCLLALDGIDAGSIFKIEGDVVTLGRGTECDIVLRDDGISRRHAKILVLGPRRLIVEDLSSTNGTFVGGKSVSRATLRVGEKILFGRRTMLRYVLDDSLDLLYENSLSESKNRDPLTGVFNRRYLKQRLATELSFSRRHHIPLSVLLFEIDQLTEMNRRHGYHTGDQMLVTMSRTIGEMIRVEDVFGRYSGEIFMIITQGIDAEGGVSFGKRVREQISRAGLIALDGSEEEITMSASVGLATVSDGAGRGTSGRGASDVLEVALDNLFQAKEYGGNRVIAKELDGPVF